MMSMCKRLIKKICPVAFGLSLSFVGNLSAAEVNDWMLTMPENWDGEIRLLGNFSFANSQKVIGQVDGMTTTIGYSLDSAFDWAEDRAEWKNYFKLNGAFSKTPSIDNFLKTQDALELGTRYLYSLNLEPRVGLYAGADMRAPILKGQDVQASAVTYSVTRSSGTTTSANRTSFDLTDPFAPLILSQSVGAFYRPRDTKTLFLEFRAGGAATEVFAEDQLVLADDGSTAGTIEITELRNYQQLGVDGGIDLKGSLHGDQVLYSANAGWMLPIAKGSASGDNRGSVDLLNQNYSAKLEFLISSWLSASYQFGAKKEPQLLDEFQVTHAFLLNLSRIFLARKEKEES